MDIERGNMEILFRKIPYSYIGRKSESGILTHNYNRIDRTLYMRHSVEVFSRASEDERNNHYHLLLEQMKDSESGKRSVFRLITDMAERFLTLDGDELKCRFDEVLRWREISFQLGQDFFTAAYLAGYDMERGIKTKRFSWLPILRSDNDRLHNILNKGMAENHFHLNGSTKVFELNWLCLMNLIDGRLHDIKKIKRSLQERHTDRFDIPVVRESFYAECQRAALYRVYLFSVMKEDAYLCEKLGRLLHRVNQGEQLEELTANIQDAITMAKNIYGAKLERGILDYALEKSIIDENANECRLLAGERKFLYDCYTYAATNRFTEAQKDLFYAYLVIRTDFRGEIIQTNRQVGFSNFADYQNRKEYFIQGEKAYEEELVRLALNESLRKDSLISLEARICPKRNSHLLYKTLKNYECIVNEKAGKEIEEEEGRGYYDKLIYVLHFPKLTEAHYVPGAPRNDNVRRLSTAQARGIAALLEQHVELNEHIRGIDACSSEFACRPEVFGQVFRYLSDIIVESMQVRRDGAQTRYKSRNLHTTYHVGEDFFDIVDGLRAIDETLLFCGLKRGSRLGHALALGIAPEEYYKMKGCKLVLVKQILLDDIVWMLCKADEFGCQFDASLRRRLEERYYGLYEEIFGDCVDGKYHPSLYEYYQSWKLRGDKPELYRLEAKEFYEKICRKELQRFNRYQVNDRVSNELRKNNVCRELYYFYHFDRRVRERGNVLTEFKVEESYVSLVRQLQDKIIGQLVCKGIGIETNPSSNYLIGTIKKYDEHPILRFNSKRLKKTEKNMTLSVSINTDDQGVFDTLLENEYALMTLALKKAKDKDARPLYDLEDIYEWADYVRQMGIEQVFP